MNRRMVAQVLKRKHKDFVESIKDEKVRKMVDENSIITGGAIASLLLQEPVTDFDYYFTNKETVLAVAHYYVNLFNANHPEIDIKPRVVEKNDRVTIKVQSAGIAGEGDNTDYKYFEQFLDEEGMSYVEKVMGVADETNAEHIEEMDKEKGKYRPIFMSSNAITLSNKVQLVIRFYGNPDEIHQNYDFAHCCNYWLSKNDSLTLTPHALESLLSKNLQYQGSLYPLCSVIRTRKFLKKGWYINAGQYLKMCFQLSELDLSNIEVLEEQLTGVDAAYFHQVIAYCRQKQEEEKEFEVTAPYLVTIVDRVFG
jgi:hypothetical protein